VDRLSGKCGENETLGERFMGFEAQEFWGWCSHCDLLSWRVSCEVGMDFMKAELF
jgi:hypothetical protein